MISVEEWRAVLKVNARAIVLELAAHGGWEAVSIFLHIIKHAHDPSRLDHEVTPDIVSDARAALLDHAPDILSEVRAVLLEMK